MKKRSRYKSYAWIHPKTRILYARVQIRQPDGGMKTYLKRATSKKHAEQLGFEMMADYAVRKNKFIAGERMTFDDLANWYIEKRVQPPIYSDDGVKISGMRTHDNVRRRIERMQKLFGKLLIKSIDEDALEQIKARLKRESPDAVPASIHRYLEDLRAMLKVAVRRRWLKENPFDFGERLIEKALERKRDVVLSEDEETALLHYAKNLEKSQLYYAMLCLLDTGARPSEIYDASTVKAEPVKWKDFFDYDFKAVQLVSLKGKRKLNRYAPVTVRLENAMRELWNSLSENERKIDAQVFQVKSFKRAWTIVRHNANLALKIAHHERISVTAVLNGNLSEEQTKELTKKFEGEPIQLKIRLRDLRRNFSTRLANLGMENDLRQRILGHSQAQTTFDYTSANLHTALAAKAMLDGDLISSTFDEHKFPTNYQM